jgi:hypothetical protein
MNTRNKGHERTYPMLNKLKKLWQFKHLYTLDTRLVFNQFIMYTLDTRLVFNQFYVSIGYTFSFQPVLCIHWIHV